MAAEVDVHLVVPFVRSFGWGLPARPAGPAVAAGAAGSPGWAADAWLPVIGCTPLPGVMAGSPDTGRKRRAARVALGNAGMRPRRRLRRCNRCCRRSLILGGVGVGITGGPSATLFSPDWGQVM